MLTGLRSFAWALHQASFVVSVILFGPGPVLAEQNARVVPILGWRTIPENELTLARFQEMADMGLTHSLMDYSPDGNAKALDLAQQVGVQLFIGDSRYAASDTEFIQAVSEVRNHPALTGYTLSDEPSLPAFAELARIRRSLSGIDPHHWSYVNLLPTYASRGQLGGVEYLEYARRFVAEFEPEVLSFDHYPILKGDSLRSDYFQNLDWIRQASIETDIPFWAFALTCPHHPYPAPTEGSVRFQAWSNFAYGAKGLQYFTYWTPNPGTWDFHDAPIKLDGTRSAVYDLLQQFNKEIQRCAEILTDGRVVGVYHTAPLPTGTSPLDASCPVSSIDGGEAIVSVHRMPDGRRFIQLVNRCFTQPVVLSITPNSWIAKLEWHELGTGAKLIGEDETGLTLALQPGATAFLRVVTQPTLDLVIVGETDAELAPHRE